MEKIIKNSDSGGNSDNNADKAYPEVLTYKKSADFAVLEADDFQSCHFAVTLRIAHNAEVIENDNAEEHCTEDKNIDHKIHHPQKRIERIDYLLF